jgi:hypothetical protein
MKAAPRRQRTWAEGKEPRAKQAIARLSAATVRTNVALSRAPVVSAARTAAVRRGRTTCGTGEAGFCRGFGLTRGRTGRGLELAVVVVVVTAGVGVPVLGLGTTGFS